VEVEASKQQAGVPRIAERLLKFVALIGGFILFAIMMLVSVAVFNRKVLNEPILGDFEIVKIGLSLVVMMAMPYVTLRGTHIRVDILDHYIGNYGRFVGDIFARLASCFVFYLLIVKTWNKMLGFGLSILVLLGQLYSQFRHGPANYE